jgi:tetraacyldisaccharide 4'-kinase
MMDWPLPIRVLLLPLSWIYGLVSRAKTWLYTAGILSQKRLNGAVISVGNLTVGGTGKTPMVMWLAEKFLTEGKRVAILSRGYRGEQGTSDEIQLLKRRLGGKVRFGVGADRFAEGKNLELAEPVDVFLLDDGFQHLKLARDVDVLMLDGSKRLKNEWLLPAGSLREPLRACRRADLLVVTRKSEHPDIERNDSHEHHIFYAQTRLLGFRKLGGEGVPSLWSETAPGPFLAFCGIGNPQAFFADLKRWSVPLGGTKEFRDHHRYSDSDAKQLESLAKKSGTAALVTTEKDEQNLRRANFKTVPVYVAVIDFVLRSESEFGPTLDRILKERRGGVS